MKPEHELQADVQRGERAKQILNDKLVRDALDTMRTNVYHNIETSHFKNVDEREDLYKMLRVISNFEAEFKRHINGGKKSASLLKQLLQKVR